MKIERTTATMYVITGANRLDPIRVYTENYAAHQKKYTNRTGVVVRKYTPLGSRYETIVIKWGKRGNRGKEFEDKFKADDLELAA
jgi:hypothetical protein